MANNNIEQYLEAMLAALDGETVPDVPTPSWNIEKYLAAILTKLSSGGGSGGGSSGGGVLMVNVDMQTRTLDKTWKEISDAPFAVLKFQHPEISGNAISYDPIIYSISASTYIVRFNDPAFGVVEFVANSEDGYPSFSE